MKTNLLQDELDNVEADALARKANLLAAAGRIAQCEILTQRLRRAGGDRICVRPFICAHTHGVPAMVRVEIMCAHCEDIFGSLVLAGLTVASVHHDAEFWPYQRAVNLLCHGEEIPIRLVDYLGDASIFAMPHAVASCDDIPVFLRKQAA